MAKKKATPKAETSTVKKLAGKAPKVLQKWDKKLGMKYTNPTPKQEMFLNEFEERRNEALALRRMKQCRGSSIYLAKPQKRGMFVNGEFVWQEVG